MIRLQWTARISRGKNQAAIQWAKATAEYLKSKYPQILAMAAYEEHFGNVNTIHIFSDYDSLATLESVEAQYPSDAAFQDLMNKSNEAEALPLIPLNHWLKLPLTLDQSIASPWRP